MSDFIDLGQSVSIFARYDLTFAARAELTKLVNHAFDHQDGKAIERIILAYVDMGLKEFAQLNARAKHTAMEAIDYIMALCRHDGTGKSMVPVLSKKLSMAQRTINEIEC